MAGPNGIPDDDGTERIGYMKALRGLVANREAIDASMARVRKAAVGYTDEELMRFAQLIIRSENAPSDWRERQFARLRGREDALEEIAMSIDSSWMPTETDEEVFMDELRVQIIRAYPNPNRVGCPDESALRSVVFGEINEHPDSDAVMQHTMKCGPCTRQVSIFAKEKARMRPSI